MLTLQLNSKIKKKTHLYYNELNDLLTTLFEVSLMDLAPSERKVPFHFCLSSKNITDYNAKGELIVWRWKWVCIKFICLKIEALAWTRFAVSWELVMVVESQTGEQSSPPNRIGSRGYAGVEGEGRHMGTTAVRGFLLGFIHLSVGIWYINL